MPDNSLDPITYGSSASVPSETDLPRPVRQQVAEATRASRYFEVLSGQLVAPSLSEAVFDLAWPQYGVDDARNRLHADHAYHGSGGRACPSVTITGGVRDRAAIR